MSGILGIFHRDGKPVDPENLGKLVDALRFRGPDEQRTWIDGNLGFGHTLLRTTWESEHEHQPFTLDGTTWLVCDARLDQRDELIASLGVDSQAPHLQLSDAELILRAYQRWGEGCVHHLLGEFAFAIWDAPARKLFCARDHLGLRPFYYAQLGETFIFSNDLRCLRHYPAISLDVNQQALVDFLVFGHNREPDTTAFSAIRKLPAAHVLVLASQGVKSSRYWELEERSTRYPRSQDYVDHFVDLFDRAVSDRARSEQISIFMSGGLDSTSVASSLARLSGKSGPRLKAFTAVEEKIAPDPEKRYSRIAADYLKIPLEYVHLDNFVLFESHERFLERDPEPRYDPLAAGTDSLLAAAASYSRVAFSGIGGDPALLATHAQSLHGVQLFSQMASTFFRIALEHRRVPKLGIRTLLRNSPSPLPSTAPPWLNPDLATRYDIRNRLQQLGRSGAFAGLRAEAYKGLADVHWSASFEAEDAECAFHRIESRRPFFSVTLLQYLLSLPPLPWFVEKYLLRRAMRGRLPDAIRFRPKTWVLHSNIESRKTQALDLVRSFGPLDPIHQLVCWKKLVHQLDSAPERAIDDVLQVICLDLWMRRAPAAPS